MKLTEIAYMNTRNFIVLILSCIVSALASGNPLTDERFEISGEITKANIEQFDRAVVKNPKINGILLSNSFGADGYAVEIVNEFKSRIDERKLNTFVKGYCVSACAALFLLGNERTMLSNPSGRPTMLLLHAVRRLFPENTNGEGQMQVTSTDKLNKQISERSGGKITIDLLDKMYAADDSSGGIFILRNPNSEGKHILFSSSVAKKIRAKPISDLTPQDLGILIAE